MHHFGPYSSTRHAYPEKYGPKYKFSMSVIIPLLYIEETHSSVISAAYNYLPARTASKSSSISLEGGGVISDTTNIHKEEKINAGSNS